jgi:SNF2 family DNA or RNA helicase
MNDAAIPPQCDPRLFADLYRHQATELAHLLSTTGHRMLYWQQGVGKTPVVARLGWTLSDRPKLYLCPATCKVQVARELRRWGGPNTRVQILEGRRAKLDPDADWIVMNYDLLPSDSILQQLIGRRWCLLVIDEAQLLRNLTAKRTQRVFGRAPCLAGQADRVVLLSGTPVINSPADLFPPINRLFPRAIAVEDASGELRRMQLAEYNARYCVFRTVWISGGSTIQVPAGGQNIAELRSKLAPYMSRLRRRDVLDLPALRIHEFALSIALNTAELTAALKTVPQELLDRLQVASGDELLTLLQRHAPQLSTLRRVLGVAKATTAADHLAERLAGGEDRVIAFFHHREVADVMLAQLRLAEISAGMIRGDTPAATRTQLIDAFDRGKLPVLLLQSQSGSLGLNLQACRYAAIVEPDWTAAVSEQAIARLYRAGQVRDVTIDFLLIPNSLDEHIVNVAHRKAALAADLIETPIKEIA